MATPAAVQSSCAFASPHHLDQALQRELTALATLEADHRSACRWLDEWSGPKAAKEYVARRLEARHRAEREAHVLWLADLHQERMLLAMAGETGEHTDELHSSLDAVLRQALFSCRRPPTIRSERRPNVYPNDQRF